MTDAEEGYSVDMDAISSENAQKKVSLEDIALKSTCLLYTSLMIPFSSAPARTVISISWRGEEQIMDSYLEKIILDGRPVFQVTIAG